MAHNCQVLFFKYKVSGTSESLYGKIFPRLTLGVLIAVRHTEFSNAAKIINSLTWNCKSSPENPWCLWPADTELGFISSKVEGWSSICPETLDENIPKMGWEHCEGDDWILGGQEEEKVPIAVVNVSGILWSRAWSYLLGFREKIHSCLKYLLVTSAQIDLKLLQGILVTQQSDKRYSPALMWRSTAAVQVPQGMGPNQKLYMDRHDGCWPQSLISKLLITNCYFSLINML